MTQSGHRVCIAAFETVCWGGKQYLSLQTVYGVSMSSCPKQALMGANTKDLGRDQPSVGHDLESFHFALGKEKLVTISSFLPCVRSTGTFKRPAIRRDVRYWHLADIPTEPRDVRFWGKADTQIALTLALQRVWAACRAESRPSGGVTPSADLASAA